ncbi:hypothetical protein CK203_031349 [Vitis vinifera]|uniref:SWIM-type domain-containing protein n=1 Tax=Vitis vinifera TaxID=29760 RepID=A0A438IX49_VITVI|nr:hypothetical protein CK203_031349 [Vitis vinifera]
MSVKCSVEGCPWKITAHAVEGNEILRVYAYQVNHNHIAQDECLSKVRVSSKRGVVVVEDVLREINPGTIAEYTSHEGHFKQLFIAHAFSIQGFTMGCRPVLAIDSCHLSGPYKGALLSAIAYDADDGMFPLALGVVGSENYEDWYWFLEKLKEILDDQENFSSFFNRQNIRGKKEDALLLLDNIAYARLDIDYNEAFEKLVRFNESFNAWLREERHQTIYTLLLMDMDKLVAMLDTHMRGTDKWKSMVGPKTEEKLMSNITRSASIIVMPYLGETFKVFIGDVYLVVDMQQHKCTCLTWQMFGLPCPHVCAVIRTLRHDVYDYIDPCFKVSTQHLIYLG